MARAEELRQKAPPSGGDDGAAPFEAALGSGIAVHMKGVLVHGFCSFVGFAPSVLEASPYLKATQDGKATDSVC